MFRARRAAMALAVAVFSAPAVHAQAQAHDAEYTRKIREYTTDPMFLTELVDHLPASSTVPSPQKVLGYVIGTPERLTYAKDVHRYFRELETASPRVKVFSLGQTEEGREQILVAISDEANLARLDRLKEPAVIDAPLGQGHVVLFAINPMWRWQTHGSHALVFNALLNWDSLGVRAGAASAERRVEAKP